MVVNRFAMNELYTSKQNAFAPRLQHGHRFLTRKFLCASAKQSASKRGARKPRFWVPLHPIPDRTQRWVKLQASVVATYRAAKVSFNPSMIAHSVARFPLILHSLFQPSQRALDHSAWVRQDSRRSTASHQDSINHGRNAWSASKRRWRILRSKRASLSSTRRG